MLKFEQPQKSKQAAIRIRLQLGFRISGLFFSCKKSLFFPTLDSLISRADNHEIAKYRFSSILLVSGFIRKRCNYVRIKHLKR